MELALTKYSETDNGMEIVSPLIFYLLLYNDEGSHPKVLTHSVKKISVLLKYIVYRDLSYGLYCVSLSVLNWLIL